jgi:hypothetical protein
VTPNRLATEKSPYLLQHARNPVDWYPWGSEAFERARLEDKPVFLSIGYSTCHWCHVMERESFEDAEVAALLNRDFVCVKVDREERPDLDAAYMGVAQMMTGRGGWPLTVVMTPDRKPFFGATYLPKTSRFGMDGLVQILPRITELWRSERAGIARTADEIASVIAAERVPRDERPLSPEDLTAAERALDSEFDSERGGFGGAPRFPAPLSLLFLLRRWRRTGDGRTLGMVERTLDALRAGGIYDHVGFGFHRYSTDDRWHIPHFEKMLYDQALLAMAYTEAWQATRRPEYQSTAREVLSFVASDLATPEGAFCSALDADSEGHEGRFYLWRTDQVREALGPDADAVIAAFGLTEEGNARHEAAGIPPGANVLHLGWPAGGADAERRARADARSVWPAARLRLLEARARRPRPALDDKVLTDWNGLAIAAFAKAARAFGDPAYAAAADRAARFVLGTMRDGNGRLLHRYRDGEAAFRATADDHAFLIWGLIELYQATFDASLLEEALALERELEARFRDGGRGGFFMAADDVEDLVMRPRDSHDGAMPSANGVAAANLTRLARITGSTEFASLAAGIAGAFTGHVRLYPMGHLSLLSALDEALGPSSEVAVAGDPGVPDTRALLAALGAAYLPETVVVFRPTSGSAVLDRVAPWTRALTAVGGRATAYVCRNGTCGAPTTDAHAMLESLAAR